MEKVTHTSNDIIDNAVRMLHSIISAPIKNVTIYRIDIVGFWFRFDYCVGNAVGTQRISWLELGTTFDEYYNLKSEED